MNLSLKKIAIIRGPYLNKFEMQSFEPLKERFEVVAFPTNNHYFPVRDINFTKEMVYTYESLLGKRIGDLVRLPIHIPIGIYHPMVNIIGKLKEFNIVDTVETFFAFSYQAAMAREKYQIKMVTHCWENIPFNHEKLFLSRKIKEKVINNTDVFISVTQRSKNALILEGVNASKIKVIPVGIDTSQFFPQPKEEQLLKSLDINRGDFVFLFVGRLTWEKGIYDLVEAFKLFIENTPSEYNNKTKLVFVGDGPDKAKLKELISRMSMEKFVRFGSFPYSQMKEVHNIADVFVLPSVFSRNLIDEWQEQFGMVLIESMCCEKPVVTTYSGSIPEVVGDCALLVQPNDPLELSNALKYYFDHNEERLDFGRRGRARVLAKYDIRDISKQFCEVYDSLL